MFKDQPVRKPWQLCLPVWQDKFMTTDLSQVLDAVGPRLRALRTQRNLTLGEVSAVSGVSVSTLSRLESG